MTIVLTTDPNTEQSQALMSRTIAMNRSDVSNTLNTNQIEMAAICVNSYLDNDSKFPQMLNINPNQRYPTVSGLQDNDYPSLREYSCNGQPFNISQFSALTTIPLPKGLLEQFGHIQQHCEMGILTTISRAWVSIDSYIYLWAYDNGTDVAYYDGLTQTILSVGLVKPKQGVFKPYIKYLLILTTTVEILLLGITFSNFEDDNDLGDLLLVPEPIFRVPTDNVVMNVIQGTADGRIFLGGRDGSVYEVVYQAEDGWFSRKCKKINHSSSALSFLIPSFLNITKEDSINQIEIDEKRHLLYTLSEGGNIEVYDLGIDGKSIYKIANKTLNSIVNEVSSVAATVDAMNFKPIISINVIDESESIHVNLIAVTKAGVRLYFTTTLISSPEQRASTLTLIHVRLPPGFTASSQTPKPSSVQISSFKRGNLSMISSQSDDRDILWTITNDCFAFSNELKEIFTITNLNSKVWIMAEEIKTIPFKPYQTFHSNNKVVALEPPLLVTQHIEEPRKFIFLSSQGVHIGFKPRIVDQLQQLLIENQGYDNEAVKSFFNLHLGSNGCAIALILACGSKSIQDIKISEWATSAFFHYGGEPQVMPSHTGQQQTQFHSYVNPQVSTPVSAANQPLFSTPSSPIALQTDHLSPLAMSTPLARNQAFNISLSSMNFSNKHDGVYLYFSRIIRPIWNLPTVTSQQTITTEGQKDFLLSNISLNEIKLYENRLTDLSQFLKNNIKFSLSNENENTRSSFGTNPTMFRSNDIYANERNSLYTLLKLIEHCIEVLGLWKLLCDHQFHAIASIIPPERQTQLIGMTFKDLIVYGNEMTTMLASALVRRFIEDNSTTDIINRRLQQVCPSIYKNENALHAKAHELVMKAKNITNPSDKALQLENALNLCKKIGARINLRSVCDLFQSVQCYEAIVDLCLLTAKNCDQQNLALHYYKNGEQMEDQQGYYAFVNRNECYKLLLEIYEHLVQQSKSLLSPKTQDSTNTFMTLEEAKKEANDMLNIAIQSSDELFHIALYNWLYEHQQSDKLLEIKSPYLENYLKRKTSAFSDSIALMDLLWMYYERNGHFRAAAQILSKLAERRSNEVNLRLRIEYLSRAIVCMKSSDSRPTALIGGNSQSTAGEFLHELEEKMDVSRIQLQILESIQLLADSQRIKEAKEALNSDLLDITHLYEHFADRFNLPESQLAILHCCSHYDINLIETIWQNIIDNLLTNVCSKTIETQKNLISTKIKDLGKLYLNSEKYFPIEFIVKYLETKCQTLGFEPQWLLQTLLELRIKLSNLLDLYHKLYKSREYGISWPRKSIHLLRVLTIIIDLFAENPNSVNISERHLFATKCLDVISGYLIDLQTMDSGDIIIRNLSHDLKGVKAKLERFI